MYTATESDSDMVQEDVIKITLLPMETKEDITISQVPCYVHSAVVKQKQVGRRTEQNDKKLETNSV